MLQFHLKTVHFILKFEGICATIVKTLSRVVAKQKGEKKMDNKININEAAHRVADFHLLSRLSHETSIDGNYQAYYHEDRLYSVKNMKSGIVSLVYANSPHDAIRRCKEHVEGA